MDGKSLLMVIQDLKEKLMDKEVTMYQRIPTFSRWVDALINKIDMYKELKDVLIEGNFKLKNQRIDKVQHIDGEIRETNIRNREKKELPESIQKDIEYT